MGLSEAIILLNRAQVLSAWRAQSIIQIDGTERLEQIIVLDNQIYALISRAIDILDEYEDEPS